MATSRLVLPLLLALAACQEREGAGAGVLSDPRWDDGAAVVSVFRGRWRKYGTWRDAEVRDYLVREFLDPEELTKRDDPGENAIPVLKANRQVRFSAGTYEYRLMHSLFLRRSDGALVKAVGTSQDGCGLTFQRFAKGEFSWDSYWEGEGRGRAADSLEGARFADELPFVAPLLEDGSAFAELPSLLRNRVLPREPVPRRVQREGAAVLVLAADGAVHARFEYDTEGFLRAWTVAGEQEFTRVSKRRMYYWQHTAPGDEKLLEIG